jgi:hypothetical protein
MLAIRFYVVSMRLFAVDSLLRSGSLGRRRNDATFVSVELV